jgi:hypothetical protein
MQLSILRLLLLRTTGAVLRACGLQHGAAWVNVQMYYAHAITGDETCLEYDKRVETERRSCNARFSILART